MASRAVDDYRQDAANDADAEARGREWFTAAELAELALPGLPAEKGSVNRRAREERWSSRTAQDGSLLIRPRKGRGGGAEFHISLLPPAARLELARRGIADAPPAPAVTVADAESARDGAWRWFAAQSERVRAEAERRRAILHEIELLEEAGMTRTAAIGEARGRHKVSPATLYNWFGLIDGVAREDRLPALAPRRKGGGREAEIDPEAWQLLVSDYLRPEQPTFSSCYHRLRKRWAAPRGIALPHERTLQRRLEREIDPLVIVSRREGAEALRRTLPPLERTVAGLHAMELVNIDGHRWDVFAKWPDGTIARPMMVAIQDVYSRKMLAWSIGRTESAVETRLAFAHLFERHGIPKACLMDNGRAFASKWITGGAKSRFRFKIRDEEPLGILTALGIAIHWATPYRGQSKPIERAFRDLCDSIAKDPAFAGAYTGNRPDAKPENYGSAAVPIDRFIEVVEQGIAEHNARPGRRTEMGRGLKSLDEVFAESIAAAPVGKATEEHKRLALLAADNRPTDRSTGAITLFDNRYWCSDLSQIAGDHVTVRFDPDDLHAPIHVYSLEGDYLCSAPVFEAAGFLDVAAAKDRKRLEKGLKNAVKAKVEAEQLLAADDIERLYAQTNPIDAEPVRSGATRIVRHRGQNAAALKAAPKPAQRRLSAAEEASQSDVIDRMAVGLRTLRAVK